jgi:hypothetical protein
VSAADFETTLRTLEKMKSNLLSTLDSAPADPAASESEARERASLR